MRAGLICDVQIRWSGMSRSPYCLVSGVLDEKTVRDLVCHWPMADARGDHEGVDLLQHDRVSSLEVDAEPAVPAEEHSTSSC